MVSLKKLQRDAAKACEGNKIEVVVAAPINMPAIRVLSYQDELTKRIALWWWNLLSKDTN